MKKIQNWRCVLWRSDNNWLVSDQTLDLAFELESSKLTSSDTWSLMILSLTPPFISSLSFRNLHAHLNSHFACVRRGSSLSRILLFYLFLSPVSFEKRSEDKMQYLLSFKFYFLHDVSALSRDLLGFFVTSARSCLRL